MGKTLAGRHRSEWSTGARTQGRALHWHQSLGMRTIARSTVAHSSKSTAWTQGCAHVRSTVTAWRLRGAGARFQKLHRPAWRSLRIARGATRPRLFTGIEQSLLHALRCHESRLISRSFEPQVTQPPLPAGLRVDSFSPALVSFPQPLVRDAAQGAPCRTRMVGKDKQPVASRLALQIPSTWSRQVGDGCGDARRGGGWSHSPSPPRTRGRAIDR